MSDIKYRLFFDNNPANRNQLNRVEEITVEQEIDMAWEARIKIPICVDGKGKWSGADENFMQSFSRIRVEIKNIEEPFIPLIDGPVVGFDSQMSFEPGQSTITIIVQDDSVYLNREEAISRFENLLDHEIAQNLFGNSEHIRSTEIEETPPAGNEIPPVVQRGTGMKLLRFLAKRHGMHAYVLPGGSPGESIGNFKPLPKQTDGLPLLILLGSGRNIKTFDVNKNAQNPSNVMASTLTIKDKGIISRTASFRDREILGTEAVLEENQKPAIQILPPIQGESVDLDQAVSAEVENSSYAFTANGSILEGCYQGVLQPYRLVALKAGSTPLSGNYLITKVTHNLSRSNYSQSFSLKRNAQSERSDGGMADLAGSIF